jgi:integral membrane protein
MTKIFKIIATLEGISLLLLFFVAMPMKYMAGNPSLIRPAGMAHGVLFVAYIIVAFLLKEEKDWSFKKYLIVAVASIIPFGTFYIEWKYLKTPENN